MMNTKNAEVAVAYQSGRAGPLIHVKCWGDYDAHYQARTGQKAFLGTLIMPGNPILAVSKCGHCGKRIAEIADVATAKAAQPFTIVHLPTGQPALYCTRGLVAIFEAGY